MNIIKRIIQNVFRYRLTACFFIIGQLIMYVTIFGALGIYNKAYQKEADRLAALYKNRIEMSVVSLNKSDILTLGEFNNIMSEAYGEAVLNNADYYSFFVNLCQKDSYVIGGDNMQSETFLDDILKEGFEGSEPLHIVIEKGTEEIIDYTNVQVTNITFRKEADDGK